MKIRRHLRIEKYPFTMEAFHPETKAVVWRQTIEAPPPGQTVAISIPPLRKQFGHPVRMRIKYADGTVEESDPKFEQ